MNLNMSRLPLTFFSPQLLRPKFKKKKKKKKEGKKERIEALLTGEKKIEGAEPCLNRNL